MKASEMEDPTWSVGVLKDTEKMGEEAGCIKMSLIQLGSFFDTLTW